MGFMSLLKKHLQEHSCINNHNHRNQGHHLLAFVVCHRYELVVEAIHLHNDLVVLYIKKNIFIDLCVNDYVILPCNRL
jgi:hypothetical protein